MISWQNTGITCQSSLFDHLAHARAGCHEVVLCFGELILEVGLGGLRDNELVGDGLVLGGGQA